MGIYSHLTAVERDRIADLKADGQSVRAIAQALGRSPATISRELRRNALASGAHRPAIAEGSYLLRRQRPAGSSAMRRSLWIFRASQKPAQLWRYLPRGKPKRGRRRARVSKDRIKDKVHVSERSASAVARAEPGHWEADVVICKRARPVFVLHERKTRLTLMARLMSKTAAEPKATERQTVAVMMAVLKRLTLPMRGSLTFDNDSTFARHTLLRSILGATTYFCDAPRFWIWASWQKGGVENANRRI